MKTIRRQIIAFLLVVIMLSNCGLPVMAEDNHSEGRENRYPVSETYVNPIYENVVDESDLCDLNEENSISMYSE